MCDVIDIREKTKLRKHEVVLVHKHHTMKMWWVLKARLHASLTSALEGDEWSVSRSCRFTPEMKPLEPIGYEDGWFSEPIWTR
jgi:hypothetical protein